MRESRPVIALDFPTFKEVQDFLELFPSEEKLYLKVGMELYYSAGPEVVLYLKKLGHCVFLDLKLHDIPNTVKSAMRVLSDLGVDMTNVHAAGGVEMMKAAREGLGKEAKLIAVTQLTSTSEEQMREFQNIQTSLQESVIHYAKKTAEAGLDGVVCSAHYGGHYRQRHWKPRHVLDSSSRVHPNWFRDFRCCCVDYRSVFCGKGSNWIYGRRETGAILKNSIL